MASDPRCFATKCYSASTMTDLFSWADNGTSRTWDGFSSSRWSGTWCLGGGRSSGTQWTWPWTSRGSWRWTPWWLGSEQLLQLTDLSLPVISLILKVCDERVNSTTLNLWSLAVWHGAILGMMPQTINLQHKVFLCHKAYIIMYVMTKTQRRLRHLKSLLLNTG